MTGNSMGSMVVTAFVAGSAPREVEAPGPHGHGGRRERDWTVRDVMSTPVIHVPPNAPVKAVAELLLTERVSGVPVVDAHGHVVGVVSEEDLLAKQIDLPAGAHVPWHSGGHFSHEFRRRREALTAEGLMSTPVTCVHPDTTLRQAAKTMYLRHLKRLPVVDGGSLIGIVSRADLLRVYLLPDEHLRRDAEHLLHGALAMGAAAVTVTVHEGVVTLEGEVATQSQADLLVRLLGRLDGVVAVDPQLHWRIDDHTATSGKHPAHV
jgi:CBS domain-containing protein